MPEKILFFVTEDWFFCSHFLDRAIAARKAGFEVCVVTRIRNHGDRISSHGLRLIPLELKRRGVRPWHELGTIRRLIRIYGSEKPDIVHHVALKPILYGSIAAKAAQVKAIVNAPVGMGYLFSSSDIRAKLARPFMMLAYRCLMNPQNSVVIVENPDDQRLLIDQAVADPKRTRLIRGAGVNLGVFAVKPEPEGIAIVILPARMLWDKGVGEFVRAAGKLKQAGIAARFVLVGNADPGNLAAIAESKLKAWQASGDIEWWGHCDDMPAVYAGSHIVCLPSYREGLPKALIEAAACGRPIVTTNVPGCREAVGDGENGYLVPARDVGALAGALRKLIEDAPLRRRMGARGRQLVEAAFSQEKVIKETLAVYRELLGDVASCKGALGRA